MSYGIEPTEYLAVEEAPAPAATEYWQAYGLEADPFPVPAAQQVCEVLPQYEQYLDLLQHLSRTSNLLLLVTGAFGIGKTTLLHQFLIETAPNLAPSEIITATQLQPSQSWTLTAESIQVCLLQADSTVDPEALLSVLTQGFNLPQLDAALTLTEQFDQQLENLQQNARLSLLIIDDAHLLPVETLGSLLYLLSLQSEVQMRFHVLLFGEPTLQEQLFALVEEQEPDDIIYALALGPLSLQQTTQYLQYRLRNVGLTGMLPFSKADIAYIDKLAAGIPAKINTIARTVMMNNLSKSPSKLKSFLQKNITTLLGGLFLALALAIILLVFSQNRTQLERVQVAPAKTQVAALPSAARPEEQSKPVAALPTPRPTALAAQQAQDEQNGQEAQQIPGEPAEPPVAAAAVAPAPQAMPSTVPAVAPAPARSAPAMSATTTQVTAAATSQRPKPEKVNAQAVAKSPVKVPATVSKAKAAPTPIALNAAKGGYTLQLIALRSTAEAKSFIEKYQLQGKVRIVTVNSQGKTFTAIVYGQYATPAQAQAALAKLPTELQRLKPWPRSIKSLEKAAVKANK